MIILFCFSRFAGNKNKLILFNAIFQKVLAEFATIMLF